MPSLIDIRRRIRSVQNTQQITSAMKMVSAAKLRRAQDKVLGARPYSSLLKDVLSSVLGGMGPEADLHHPLLEAREERRIVLVLMAGEKGLCGAFNSHVLRASLRFIQDHPQATIQVEALGRKAVEFHRRRKSTFAAERPGVLNIVEFSAAQQIARQLIERYGNQEIDAVYLLYNRFKSALSQVVTLEKLLPLAGLQQRDPKAGAGAGYIYEQPPEQIFASLLPRYVEINVYQAMIESAAAEHAARMTAMDAATRNAGEVIEKLTLFRNRVRQASITTDLIEVISGAAAQEG
jgi:F-type H+-transporting ATPase subunit gamma